MEQMKSVRMDVSEWEEVINSLKDFSAILRRAGNNKRADLVEDLTTEMIREKRETRIK